MDGERIELSRVKRFVFTTQSKGRFSVHSATVGPLGTVLFLLVPETLAAPLDSHEATDKPVVKDGILQLLLFGVVAELETVDGRLKHAIEEVALRIFKRVARRRTIANVQHFPNTLSLDSGQPGMPCRTEGSGSDRSARPFAVTTRSASRVPSPAPGTNTEAKVAVLVPSVEPRINGLSVTECQQQQAEAAMSTCQDSGMLLPAYGSFEKGSDAEKLVKILMHVLGAGLHDSAELHEGIGSAVNSA
ncbi:hypothetical protein J3459_015257 [Metarhizium acridum]|uniref:uncharacterized protein n=1 Tax=Metarhizium acridum TaxID=92637 RepID=UPI001C6C6610|nr:hypothetical protein J3459_015257 [Metarhizium acridum]KAG8414112.1 hypothetical protein J3458_011762 [Metarhizium acridum]